MDEDKQADYEVSLSIYEGPLDLLLHLVHKNRVDIKDIPIHEITDQYLAYLDAAKSFDLELSSSFFAMAATLLYIKSRMLLPRKPQDEPEEAGDPRRELARSLEEFRRMKEIRARLERLMEAERPYRTKAPEEIHQGLYTGIISIRRLEAAFRALYQSLAEREVQVLAPEEVSLDEEIQKLRELMQTRKPLSVITYFRKAGTRLRLAVSLIALLELIRLGEIILFDTPRGLAVKGRQL
ncbi:MAG: segregation/condensation protein A [Dialister sp.]|nr:segregation/condensation protein A [Dialister sp.]